MQQPGAGEAVPFLVPTRNISEGGLSYLHGGFVHIGTRCLVQLVTSHGTWNNVIGTVARCRHVGTGLHEVGLEFDHELEPAEYCAEAARPRVLLAEDSPTMSRLTIFHLEQLNAEVDHAENGRIAVDRALQKPYDLIIMDINLPVLNGLAAVGELRSKGYTGMIVAATSLTAKSDRTRCLKAGYDRYLGKPLVRQDLENLLKSLHEEPLFSSLSDDPSMTGLIGEFVAELPARIRDLEVAAQEGNAEGLQVLARALKAQGGSYGFEIITEVAAKIETALLGSEAVENVREDVQRLVKLCMQARSSTRHTLK